MLLLGALAGDSRAVCLMMLLTSAQKQTLDGIKVAFRFAS